MTRRFSWLHFTDLHVGMSESSHRWPTMRRALLDDLAKVHRHLRQVDVVFFTGDLTNRGTEAEFSRFDEEMAKIREALSALGSSPLLLAVPGNHDLVRPDPKRSALRDLRRWRDDRELREMFWSEPGCDHRELVRQAFSPWSAWAERALSWGELTDVVRDGVLPGDFLATFSSNGVRVGLVGLNTAALQLEGGDYEGRLSLHPSQLTQLSSDPGGWAESHDACFLLTHHDPSWLDEEGRADFREHIYPSERFVLHFCGHRHEQRNETRSEGGGPWRRVDLGRSLFGQETYGNSVQRLYGYSAGYIEFGSPPTLHRWPRRDEPKQDGSRRLGPDGSAYLDDDGGLHETLHPTHRAAPVTYTTFPPRALIEELSAWLEQRYHRPLSRRSLLSASGLSGNPALSWAQLLVSQPAAVLARLLGEVHKDDADDGPAIAGFLERLGQPSEPASFEDVLLAEFEDQLEEARSHLAAERYEQAAALYERIERRAGEPRQDTSKLRAIRARARLNRAAALGGLGDIEGSNALISSVEPSDLNSRGRLNLGRFLVGAGKPEQALQAIEGVDEPGALVVLQLVQIHRGEIPGALAEDPDVLLWAAIHHLQSQDAGSAADLALRASRAEGINERGRHQSASLLAHALLQQWHGEASEPIQAPAEVLARLRELISSGGARADWAALEALRRACEEIPQEIPVEPAPEDAPTPAWLSELQVTLRAEDHTGALRALATRRPHVGPVLMATAFALHEAGTLEGSLDLARRAFALLPGYGQRKLLARVLFSSGHLEEAQQHIEALQPPLTEDVWELTLQLAIARGTGDPIQLGTAWEAARPDSVRAPVWLVQAHLQRGDVRKAREAAWRALRMGDRLAIDDIRVLAVASWTQGAPFDPELARRILGLLESEHLRGDPVAEMLRHHLLLATGDHTDTPIDWELLSRAGIVRPFTVEEMVEGMRTNARRNALMDRAWEAGAFVFETRASLRGMRCGDAALAFSQGERVAVPPLPVFAPKAWKGRKCHLGALGIELLVALGLHEAFGDAVQTVVIFRDTALFTQKGAQEPVIEFTRTEQAKSAETWKSFEGLPEVDPKQQGIHALKVEDLPGIVAWLSGLGLVERTNDPPWSPPGGTLVLDARLVYELARQGLARPFLEACQHQKLALGLDPRAVRARRERARELELRVEASSLGDEISRWLVRLRDQGKLEVVTPPAGPPLAPLRSGDPDPDWIARAFATRELLLADPELVLVSSELVEMGLQGFGPGFLVQDRAWRPEPWAEHRHRYGSLSGRWVTLPAVVRALAPDARRAEIVGRLARAGYVDAFEPRDVRALFDAYGGLHGIEPSRRLLGLVQALAGQDRHPHLGLLGLSIAVILTETIAEAWLGAEVQPQADALTVSVLDTLEQMDRVTRGRVRLLDAAVVQLVGASHRAPARFTVAKDEANRTTPPDSVGQRMWRVVSAWADPHPPRRASLDLGLAQAIRMADRSELGVAESVFGCIFVEIPPPPRGDLCGSTLGAVFNRRARFASLLRERRLYDRSIEEWRSTGTAALAGASLSGTDLQTESDGVPIALALEGALPEALPLARQMASELWAHDGVVAEALRRWADHPSDATLEVLRRSLDASPVRSIRADPRILVAWSHWADRSLPAPRRQNELLALLSEPLDQRPDQSLLEMLRARFEPGGAWSEQEISLMGRQLARIPGVTISTGFAFLPVDEMLPYLARIPEQHAYLPTGSLVDALLALGISGKTEPVRRLENIEVRLPELVARAAAAALVPVPQQGPTYAENEPALLRACGAAVEAVTGMEPLPPDRRIWLSWRLFGWLTEQILSTPDRFAAARALAELAPGARDPEECVPDLYDPWRVGPGRVDTRELSVLQALGLLRTAGAVDWHLLKPALLAVASRALTPDERLVRETWTEPSLGGRALVAPDLAKALLLTIDNDMISEMPALQRMGWLDDALRSRPEDAPLQELASHVSLAFATRAHLWSETEGRRVLEAIQAEDFEVNNLGRRVLLIAASGRGEGDALRQRAREIVWAGLGGEDEQLLVSEWLLASARRNGLEQAVRELRAELSRRQIPEIPHLRRLSRVLIGGEPSARDQAWAVLRRLAEEPALAESDALGELFQSIAGRIAS
jgi:tetratricopeptide (TPR) repeat protein